MRSIPILLTALLSCAIPSGWATELQSATPVDFKAEYCATVYRARISIMAAMAKRADTSAPPELMKLMQEDIDREGARLRRVQTYILSRSKTVDLAPTAAATRGAEEDLSRANSDATKCGCSVVDAACNSNCVRHSEAAARLRSCNDLSFLPF
jgi:hypothetical protein